MTAEEHVAAVEHARVRKLFIACCYAIEAHANLGKLGLLCDGSAEERDRFIALRARLLELDGKEGAAMTVGEAVRAEIAAPTINPAQHYDIDGNPCSLDDLCIREPRWAASRIRVEREEMAKLRDCLARADVENMSLDAQLAETERQLEGMRAEYRKLQVENAELRATIAAQTKRRGEWEARLQHEQASNAGLRGLCGRAAKCVPLAGRGVTMVRALEAAARGAK